MTQEIWKPIEDLPQYRSFESNVFEDNWDGPPTPKMCSIPLSLYNQLEKQFIQAHEANLHFAREEKVKATLANLNKESLSSTLKSLEPIFLEWLRSHKESSGYKVADALYPFCRL